MAKLLTKSRRYRLPETLVEKLQKLRQFNVIESKFVRAAIEEKLQRDLPKLKIPDKKEWVPF
jgi:hypothetical protein